MTTALAILVGNSLGLVPLPASIHLGTGFYRLTEGSEVHGDKPLRAVGDMLREYLRPSTGFTLPEGGKQAEIIIRLDPSLGSLGSEGYRISVTARRVEVRAAGEAGAFYGVQTLRQLLPAAAFRRARVANSPWLIPCVEIEDSPRFSWRGAHLDVGRHFMPKEFILKFLDMMALHKLNTFHWHLTDDQGWRIEIKKYPRLTGIGAYRKDNMLRYDPPVFEGKPHGGYYTQDDIREVVAYAAARHITVVPEIEMPGHAQAAIAAYPELGNTGENLDVATTWGVIENVMNVEDSTVQFCKDVLSEVMDLFPSKFIHVGGDEVPKRQWKESPKAQERMRSLGLKDEHELQSWFMAQIDAFLTSQGRRLIGWDEILEGGLAPGAAVMSWRGTDGGIAAAKAGHDVVMAPTSHTYLDYYQSEKRESEPWAIGGFLPLDTVYSFEPMPADLDAGQSKHILGAQAQLWTEYIADPKHVEYMAYPRLCALAEVVWSPKATRDFSSFKERLGVHTGRLSALDVNFRKLD